jgi:hypothetical protein
MQVLLVHKKYRLTSLGLPTSPAVSYVKTRWNKKSQENKDWHSSNFCLCLQTKRIVLVKYDRADHGGNAVYGRNCIRSLERWDRGFEPVYSVFVLSCGVFAVLRRTEQSFKEFYRQCKKDNETEEEARPNKVL